MDYNYPVSGLQDGRLASASSLPDERTFVDLTDFIYVNQHRKFSIRGYNTSTCILHQYHIIT